MGLRGKVALVTGAARGIGEAVARQMAQAGASVVVADVREALGLSLAAELENALFVHLDVGDEVEWGRAVNQCQSRYGRIDVLVNSAGIFHTAPIADTSLALFERIVRVNQTGTFLGMRAVLPAMKERGGSIVNISSTSGLRGNQNSVAYGASKWAVRGMSKVAAVEFGQYGIRVNSVHPGLIDTPMNHEEMGHDRIREVGASVPLARAGRAEEVASVVAFLASDAAAYVSGGEYTVDGAMSAGVLRSRFSAKSTQ
ncbi:glucose 1-dehydrogenase [Hydrogenophaga sp. BPS33]|nr:glucose 1-dehydrogenase [Hydrogenophaga sp. BPS33]